MPLFKFYTADYEGERVVDTLHWRDANKEENSVWIPKTIINDDHSETAFVIGNGPSRLKYNLELLNGQHGGAGGIKSVGQSYGCNMLFKDFSPTFLICSNQEICDEIAKTNYCEDNIVYSIRKCIVKHPGLFHLYPHWQNMFAGPAAVRLACADGHKRIFMLGFDFYNESTKHLYPEMTKSYKTIDSLDVLNDKLKIQLRNIFDLYDDVEFYHVQPERANYAEHVIEEWNWCPNVKTIGMLQFINLAQLGAVHK